MAPSHASAPREGGGEALTGGVQAGLLSSEIDESWLSTLFPEGEDGTEYRENASGTPNQRSQRPTACTQTSCTETGRSQLWPIVSHDRSGRRRLDAVISICTQLGSRTQV
jgi:hypothetical protein